MKRLSLKLKITLWFTAALLVIVSFTYFIVLSVSDQILQKTIKDNLIETVEANLDEIKFHATIGKTDLEKNASRFLEFEGGYLEVDDDFLDEVNQVYSSLYSADHILIYGENPISKAASDLPFSNSRIQRLKSDGVVYYIFDRQLTTKGLEGLWMRGVVSETQGRTQMTDITRICLFILPVLVLFSSVGGYLLVQRMLRPIQKISETARQIGQENDLKKRIRLGSGNDELHQLGDTFNDMFEKLDRSFETERRFISDASHELRTPMSVIAAQCEYSLEQSRSPGEYEEAFRVIQRQSRKMSRLIHDMLDFTRLELGTDRYKKETIDLTELVSSVCSDMALIREKGISLQYEVQRNIRFTGNHELLSRLLVNLISNAYRYGRANGHILVRLTRQNREIRLCVSDDGIGIAKDEQEKIFLRFYQADSSRSDAGIGLGLSMAKEITRFHSGKILVESEPGKGSVFTVIFSG